MYRLKHHPYCGMSGLAETFDEKSEARIGVAKELRDYRKCFKVVTLSRGKEWEILEPDNAVMVPEACGNLTLTHFTFDCVECGGKHETQDGANDCCTANDMGVSFLESREQYDNVMNILAD